MMTSTRRVVRGLAFLGLSALMGAAAPSTPASRGWAVAPDATVRLYVPAGQLTVSTWDRDSVHLSGTLHANASMFGGGARTHVKIGVEARAQDDATLPRATLAVRVPRRARLWVKMIDGALEISGTRVELEAYTVRGQVNIRDVAGSTTIESIDAPVRLSRASGDVRVRGSRALVRFDSVHALASIATVSGAVQLEASSLEGRVETVGGAVSLDGVRAGGMLSIQSHAGNVTLRLRANERPKVHAWSRGTPVSDVTHGGDARFGTIDVRTFKGRVHVESRR